MTNSADRRKANTYTKLAGYVWFYTDYPNGDFVVLDRRGLGEKWYLEPDQHRWVIMKMPEERRKTASTKDEAKQIAIEAARSMSDFERWW